MPFLWIPHSLNSKAFQLEELFEIRLGLSTSSTVIPETEDEVLGALGTGRGWDRGSGLLPSSWGSWEPPRAGDTEQTYKHWSLWSSSQQAGHPPAPKSHISCVQAQAVTP